MNAVVNFKDLGNAVKKQMDDIQKQIRFAQMKALNETAFKARANVIAAFKGSFNVRNSKFPQTVKVEKATKEHPQAVVKFPHDFVYLSTVGGTKAAEEKSRLAIPIKFGSSETRMPSGKIKASKRPTALLDYSNKHPVKTRGHVANPHAFKIKTSGNKVLIAKRQKGSREVDWLYVLVKNGKVKNRWDFDKIVETTTQRNLQKEFDKALKWALEHPK